MIITNSAFRPIYNLFRDFEISPIIKTAETYELFCDMILSLLKYKDDHQTFEKSVLKKTNELRELLRIYRYQDWYQLYHQYTNKYGFSNEEKLGYVANFSKLYSIKCGKRMMEIFIQNGDDLTGEDYQLPE
jgi:hypothetical protein